jgi:hypothetical protein
MRYRSATVAGSHGLPLIPKKVKKNRERARVSTTRSIPASLVRLHTLAKNARRLRLAAKTSWSISSHQHIRM